MEEEVEGVECFLAFGWGEGGPVWAGEVAAEGPGEPVEASMIRSLESFTFGSGVVEARQEGDGVLEVSRPPENAGGAWMFWPRLLRPNGMLTKWKRHRRNEIVGESRLVTNCCWPTGC